MVGAESVTSLMKLLIRSPLELARGAELARMSNTMFIGLAHVLAEDESLTRPGMAAGRIGLPHFLQFSELLVGRGKRISFFLFGDLPQFESESKFYNEQKVAWFCFDLFEGNV